MKGSQSTAKESAKYRVADLLIDVGLREVTRADERIDVGRLTFELLLALVEQAPNVLSHDEIIDRVWQGRATSPETVTQRVKLLRDALSDDAEKPRYIALVRGQGYRLLPPCQRIADVESVVPEPIRQVSNRLRAGIGVAAIAVVAVSVAVWRQEGEPSGSAPPTMELLPASIAVLPFENLSPDPRNAYFAVGFHDTLLSELASITGLHVIARSSVERYASEATPLQTVAGELHVQTVMVGSVQFDGNRIRLTAALVDPRTSAQLWAQSFERPLDDVFAMQTEIAVQIASVLEARLMPSERLNIETPPTSSTAAYALYMEARVDTDSRRLPLDDDRSRLPLLDRAISLDPDFALAYVARAEVFAWAFAYSEAGSGPEEVARRREYERRALEDAARALEIDPALPGPWVIRGIVDLENWRWDAAETDFRTALELGPNDPDVLLQSAFFHLYAGRFQTALELARRRLAIDPGSVESNNGLGFIAIVAGDPQTAIQRYQAVESLVPGIWFYRATVALAYVQDGDRSSAAEAVRMAGELRSPDDIGVFLTNVAIVNRWLGRMPEARTAFSDFEAWTRNNVVSEGDWALAYQGVGDYDRMFEALQRAVARIEAHEPDSHQALILIAANVVGDPVLEEPRFRDVRSRLLPDGDLAQIGGR